MMQGMSLTELIDDEFMQPPGREATLPGLASWQVEHCRRLARWAILNALRENGSAMAECIEGSPRGRRRPWRRSRD
jgi:hypothetical protein